MEARLHARLREGAEAVEAPIDAALAERLGRYCDLLLTWNRRINLTALRTPVEVVDRHLVDSLALLPWLQSGKVLDVGTGAGLPGLVLAAARPALRVTLLDSVQKKLTFVRAAARELGVEVEIVGARFEAFAAGHAGAFDTAVSRAAFPPAEWLARAWPVVGAGGQVVVMLAEGAEAPPAPGEVGPEARAYRLPDGTRRVLLRYRVQAVGSALVSRET